MRPVTRTLPCQPKVHPEVQGCGRGKGRRPGSARLHLCPQRSLLCALPNRGPDDVAPLHVLEAPGHSEEKRSPVVASAACGPLRAAACLTALPPAAGASPRLGHPAPHASSVVRGTFLPRDPSECSLCLGCSPSRSLPLTTSPRAHPPCLPTAARTSPPRRSPAGAAAGPHAVHVLCHYIRLTSVIPTGT